MIRDLPLAVYQYPKKAMIDYVMRNALAGSADVQLCMHTKRPLEQRRASAEQNHSWRAQFLG